MECGIRSARYLSEISTVRELKEARRELELREWFARERLAEDVAGTFTLSNLLSIVAPEGSLVDRMIGSVGTGVSVAQGIFGLIGSFFGGKTSRRKPAAKPVVRPVAKAVVQPAAKAAKAVKATKAAPRTASGRSAAKSQAPKGRATAIRKRTPEIEVEVELEPKSTVRSRTGS